MFTDRFVEMSFFNKEVYFQVHWKQLNFSRNLLSIYEKMYQFNNRLLSGVPVYFPRVGFHLTSLSTAFETVCGGILSHIFDISFGFLEKCPSQI